MSLRHRFTENRGLLVEKISLVGEAKEKAGQAQVAASSVPEGQSA